jgi:hypothetical protein
MAAQIREKYFGGSLEARIGSVKRDGEGRIDRHLAGGGLHL